ncbi:MAG: GAF domain-containing protein [Dokdonella sp.]
MRLLNARTPHRFTGIYRYDGAFLRNVMLFDQHNPELLRGDNAPIGTTYCALVPQFGGSLAVEDARQDPRTALRSKATPVISYCGVLLRDTDGHPFGTLCHFDLLPCQQRTSDIEWLQLLSPMLARAALRQMAAVNPS